MNEGRTAKPVGRVLRLLTGTALTIHLVLFIGVSLIVIAMVVVAFLDIGSQATGVVWALCLSVFGFGCVSNAMRCGRLHCYFTGPFLLVMAVSSLLHGFGLISLGSLGWLWIGLVTLVGGIGLAVVPERIWGQYAGGGGARGQSCS